MFFVYSGVSNPEERKLSSCTVNGEDDDLEGSGLINSLFQELQKVEDIRT